MFSLLLLLILPRAHAGDTNARVSIGATHERFALVVGVEKYRLESGLGPLSFAADDARRVASVLMSHGLFRESDIRLLVADAQEDAPTSGQPSGQPTQQVMLQALSDLSTMRVSDTVVVYFSGHGFGLNDVPISTAEEGGANYLLPMDAVPPRDPDELRRWASTKPSSEVSVGEAGPISIQDVVGAARATGAQNVVVIVDACRNDPTKASAPLTFVAGEARLPQGVTILYASSPGQRSHEDPRVGLGRFTRYLTEGLEGPADGVRFGRPSAPADGYVDAEEALAYAANQLAVGNGVAQIPTKAGEWVAPARLTQVSRSSERKWEPCAESDITLQGQLQETFLLAARKQWTDLSIAADRINACVVHAPFLVSNTSMVQWLDLLVIQEWVTWRTTRDSAQALLLTRLLAVRHRLRPTDEAADSSLSLPGLTDESDPGLQEINRQAILIAEAPSWSPPVELSRYGRLTVAGPQERDGALPTEYVFQLRYAEKTPFLTGVALPSAKPDGLYDQVFNCPERTPYVCGPLPPLPPPEGDLRHRLTTRGIGIASGGLAVGAVGIGLSASGAYYSLVRWNHDCIGNDGKGCSDPQGRLTTFDTLLMGATGGAALSASIGLVWWVRKWREMED